MNHIREAHFTSPSVHSFTLLLFGFLMWKLITWKAGTILEYTPRLPGMCKVKTCHLREAKESVMDSKKEKKMIALCSHTHTDDPTLCFIVCVSDRMQPFHT